MSLTVKTAVIHGLAWLYEIEQPPGALVDHHGITVRVVDEARMLHFIPEGSGFAPVIVLGVDTFLPGHTSARLNMGELDALAQWCRFIRTDVAKTWNGQGESGSIGLVRTAHPSLLTAVEKYRAGCTTHNRSVFCDCGWKRHGRSLLRIPRMLDRSETTS